MEFESQPTLESATVRLRPVGDDDFAALFAVAADPELWAQHPSFDRYKPDVFRSFFDDAMQSASAFVIIDKESDRIIGSSRYNDLDMDASEVEIGWTFIARSHWGGATNLEVKKLMLEHAFRFVNTVVFWVGTTNIRSRRAVEKLGARLRDTGVTRAGSSHVIYALQRGQARPENMPLSARP